MSPSARAPTGAARHKARRVAARRRVILWLVMRLGVSVGEKSGRAGLDGKATLSLGVLRIEMHGLGLPLLEIGDILRRDAQRVAFQYRAHGAFRISAQGRVGRRIDQLGMGGERTVRIEGNAYQ